MLLNTNASLSSFLPPPPLFILLLFSSFLLFHPSYPLLPRLPLPSLFLCSKDRFPSFLKSLLANSIFFSFVIFWNFSLILYWNPFSCLTVETATFFDIPGSDRKKTLHSQIALKLNRLSLEAANWHSDILDLPSLNLFSIQFFLVSSIYSLAYKFSVGT